MKIYLCLNLSVMLISLCYSHKLIYFVLALNHNPIPDGPASVPTIDCYQNESQLLYRGALMRLCICVV